VSAAVARQPPSLIRSLSFAAAEKVVRACVTFVVGIAVLRHLGPEGNAELSNVVATVALFATLAKLGLDNVVLREVADRPGESARTIGQFMILRLAASIATVSCLIYFAELVFPGKPMPVVLIAAALVLIQASDLGLLWCQGLRLLQFTSIVMIAVVLVSAAVKIVLILTGATYVAFLVLLIADLVVAGMAMNIGALRFRPRGGGVPPAGVRITSVPEVGYSLAISVVTVAYFSFDAVVLPRLMPLEEAGRFLAAKSLVDGASAIGGSFTVALFPFLVAARNRSGQALDEVFEASLTVAAYLGLAMAGALILGYFLVIDTVLGSRFHGIGGAIVCLALGMALFFQAGLIDSRLTIHRRVGTVLVKAVLALALKAAMIIGLGQSLTPTVIAVTTIVSAYAATLAVTYFALPAMFWSQTRSLSPTRLIPAVNTLRGLR